ncbi:MAG TPA: metallophosphoesterase, partial [Rhizobiales bacterium]|nr:metallophosphoesterase [Hyphomicrobiales bacterium]
MFKLAHLSDVHLGPMPAATVAELASKRIIGLMSWKLRRQAIHNVGVLNRVVTDIKQAKVDHIAFTGDLANISLPKEFSRGQHWLAELGTPDKVSFVPGNHDTYVCVPWDKGLALWGDYMVGDLNMPGVRMSNYNAALFPYVRRRKNIALIGVTSAIPAPWNKAWGHAGQRQLAALAEILTRLHGQGFYRIVMIHHPPLPGLAKDRKALRDAVEMESVLKKCGAELVLHGHNHQHMHTELETGTG